MTPLEAQTIYHAARMAEYAKHRADNCPVNEQAVILAGFQAVIDAVTKAVDDEWALKILDQQRRL